MTCRSKTWPLRKKLERMITSAEMKYLKNHRKQEEIDTETHI